MTNLEKLENEINFLKNDIMEKSKLLDEYIKIFNFIKETNNTNISIKLGILNELSDRENDVYLEIKKGKQNEDIAKTLYISKNTVKKHISNILDKLNLKSRNEIIIHKIFGEK